MTAHDTVDSSVIFDSILSIAAIMCDDQTGAAVLPISTIAGAHGIRTAHRFTIPLDLSVDSLDKAWMPLICQDLSGTHDDSAFIQHIRSRSHQSGLQHWTITDIFEFEILYETKEPIPSTLYTAIYRF
jgi:hypothetical protein